MIISRLSYANSSHGVSYHIIMFYPSTAFTFSVIHQRVHGQALQTISVCLGNRWVCSISANQQGTEIVDGPGPTRLGQADPGPWTLVYESLKRGRIFSSESAQAFLEACCIASDLLLSVEFIKVKIVGLGPQRNHWYFTELSFMITY